LALTDDLGEQREMTRRELAVEQNSRLASPKL
jgi:hypothetical protein